MTTESGVNARDDSETTVSALRRKIRVLGLLKGVEDAGLAPVRVLRLHALAYLANVLAPVWDMPSFDGKVLKRRGGPFYPALQADLDRLVGLGLVHVSNLKHVKDVDDRWRLEGEYRLDHGFADPVLAAMARYEEHGRLLGFVRELAFAVSAIADDELDAAPSEDATYSNPAISNGNVVDFGEWQDWRQVNASVNAAEYFATAVPGALEASPGERLHLYARHLAHRIHARR